MLQNIRKLKSELLTGVEKLVREKKISYLEAVIHFCEHNSVDLVQAAQIVQNDEIMTAKIELEAEGLNMLKYTKERLPV